MKKLTFPSVKTTVDTLIDVRKETSKHHVVYSEYKAGNTVNQIKMAVTTVFNAQLSTSCTIPNMETGHAALALHRTGNPSGKI